MMKFEHVVFGGDMNTDLDRSHSLHVGPLQDFCVRHSLKFCVMHPQNEVPYSYMSDWNGAHSTIDHMMVTDNMYELISKYVTKDDADNFSDHNPVLLSLDMITQLGRNPISHDTSRLAWHRSSDHNIMMYQQEVKRRLCLVDVPVEAVECNDFQCTQHAAAISEYYNQVMNVIQTSAKETIPMRKKKSKAGWNEHVEPLREKSLFWNTMWVQCGRPRQGWVHRLRTITKSRYKRAVRWVLRNQDKLAAERAWQKN
ncbi:hypothetical protein CAPTEDRAFT_205811 [Capitella teleta]|uniref:Endonuclease/exonuclease/phosphatase domain-containing protein n=1 Tax=Capitella teleta TaxID=283909 RepID=R7TC34_CAPTE|nr:hypothetical protein CAPTEDRAFT_205811 [Capitella teleta]|eukprot:ELT91273.1 hypothetical protein CAPTEDRAFT_205811 [Capitella teleta]